MAQMVERSYVKQEAGGSTPDPHLYFPAILLTIDVFTDHTTYLACWTPRISLRTLCTMCHSQGNSCNNLHTPCTTPPTNRLAPHTLYTTLG